MAKLMQQSGGQRSVEQGKGFARVLALSSIAAGAGFLWYDMHLRKKHEAAVPADASKEGRHPGVEYAAKS